MLGIAGRGKIADLGAADLGVAGIVSVSVFDPLVEAGIMSGVTFFVVIVSFDSIPLSVEDGFSSEDGIRSIACLMVPHFRFMLSPDLIKDIHFRISMLRIFS
jgi:hypothetical protein